MVKNLSSETIRMLEAELFVLEEMPKTKKTNEQISGLKQQISKQKQTNKIAALEFEQDNYTHLLFYDSDKGYKKMTGHSALIYAANIARRLGRRANLREDTDHYARSDDGVVSVVLDEKLEQAMAAIKIKKDEELSTKHLHFYKLPMNFNKDQIAKFRDAMQQDSREINKILLPKSPVPTLFSYLKELNEIVYHNANNMSTLAKQTVGVGLFGKTREMLAIYLKMANGNEKTVVAYKKIYRLVVEIKSEIKTVEILHLMSNRNICRLLEKVTCIERLVSKLLRVELARTEMVEEAK